mgnify:CR=1 FL=1
MLSGGRAEYRERVVEEPGKGVVGVRGVDWLGGVYFHACGVFPRGWEVFYSQWSVGNVGD